MSRAWALSQGGPGTGRGGPSAGPGGSLGWVGHAIKGDVDYQLLLLMGAGAAVGSYYGAKLTGKVDLATLVGAMGYVLLAVGVILIWRGVS